MADRTVDVGESKRVYQGFFSVYEEQARYERSDGSLSDWTERSYVERGDAVAVLLWIVSTEKLVLVRQFRCALLRHGDAFPTEVVAGSIDPGETAQQAALRELEEEVGLRLNDVRQVGEYYGSPGGLSEKVTIFFGEIEEFVFKATGGLPGEDLEILQIEASDVYRLFTEGKIRDGKTQVALSWFFLQGKGKKFTLNG